MYYRVFENSCKLCGLKIYFSRTKSVYSISENNKITTAAIRNSFLLARIFYNHPTQLWLVKIPEKQYWQDEGFSFIIF